MSGGVQPHTTRAQKGEYTGSSGGAPKVGPLKLLERRGRVNVKFAMHLPPRDSWRDFTCFHAGRSAWETLLIPGGGELISPRQQKKHRQNRKMRIIGFPRVIACFAEQNRQTPARCGVCAPQMAALIFRGRREQKAAFPPWRDSSLAGRFSGAGGRLPMHSARRWRF